MSKKTQANTDRWSIFKPLFKQIEVPARTILLEEGSISKTMFFIEKGCLRTWINNNGKDITTQFFFEGGGVSSIESFMTGKPSLYTIESIEPCVIQTITQKDFQDTLQNSPELKDNIIEHLYMRLLKNQQVFFSYLKNTPQQRYEQLLAEHPEIIQRIPQHYIASYLGITSVSLSRIRNRR
ncbi:Crp/Fnr family transcriptional regulator [Flavobacterium sp. NPDC079362]|uniref:Crp/Fnr family transcriptional regulator n=1 Tax=Flavobacterium sp. NPDC079362 TaxID=3390566 RepID=UPI003CFD6BF1